MAQTALPPAPHDGSSGNVLQRAEPKVKASALAALLTPLALYYVYRYVPGVAALPHELDALLATLVTGLVTFLAGYAARAVDRVDLFTRGYLADAEHAVTQLGDRTIGAAATEDLETWTRDIASKAAAPIQHAAADTLTAVQTAAAAGTDPVAAARAQLPEIADSLRQAVTDGRAEAQTVTAPAVAAVEADAPALIAEAAAAAAGPKTPDELMAELRQMIAMLDAGTPLADAAHAAAQSAPAPATLGPVTQPMQAVAAGTAPATA